MTEERLVTTILMKLTASWTMSRRWRRKESSRLQEPKRIIKDIMSITRIPSLRWEFEHQKCWQLLYYSQEHMILPTPPLPPWKGRRPVQRSYSSEMLNSDTMLRYSNGGELTSLLLVSLSASDWSGVGDYRERAETQIPTESSGYHSGSLSKSHKSNSGEMSWNIFKSFPIQILLWIMELKADYFKVLWSFVHHNFLRGMIHQNHVQHASDHD